MLNESCVSLEHDTDVDEVKHCNEQNNKKLFQMDEKQILRIQIKRKID